MKTLAHAIAVVCWLAALAGLTGCKSLETGARETFSKDFSCPEGRVDVLPRKDLDAYDLAFGATAAPAPPADVKADPERYALWQKQQRAQHASWNDRLSVFEARGCGHVVVYTCSHPDAPGGGVDLGRAACAKANHQPGAAKK